MRNIGWLVVVPAVLWVSAPASILYASDDAEDPPAIPSVPFFISVDAELRHDPNDSDLDPGGVDNVGALDLRLAGEWGGRKINDDRILEAAVGFSGWKTALGENAFEQDFLEVYGRVDYDLPEGAAKAFGLQRLTVGGQYAGWGSRVGGESSANGRTWTLATQATWNEHNSCNFDNVLLYYESSDVEDDPDPDPALSRDGAHSSLGVEVNFYLGGAQPKGGCMRPGILRRNVMTGFPSLAAGYRHDDVDAVGEFKSSGDEVYFDGRIPLVRRGRTASSSLDLSVGVSRIDYDNPSVFPPFVARDDTPVGIEVAWVRHLWKSDLRFGYRSQRNTSSDIPRYEYERDIFFVAWKFELFRDDTKPTAGGSSSDRRGGQTGSSDPVVPGTNP